MEIEEPTLPSTSLPHVQTDDNHNTSIQPKNNNSNINNNGNTAANQPNEPSISPSSSSPSSISPSPLTTEEKELKKAEQALQKLLDHSMNLTAKLRDKLHSHHKRNKKKHRHNHQNNKHRNNNIIITEENEDKLITDDQDLDLNTITHFDPHHHQQPSSITGGTMRGYQIECLNWLIQLFELNRNGIFINGILADDMGLGKTLETISLISYLKQYRNIHGPHIVIVPLSTANNWIKEFMKWDPSINVFLFHGDQQQRQSLINSKVKQLKDGMMDVMVTSYEMAMIEKSVLSKIKWQYLIIDEAHRIKNDESKLSKVVRLFHTKYRLLLTGTPLQNNMKELWALLNFLVPQLFSDCRIFTEQFSNQNLSNNPQIVDKLHRIIKPFMLRRLKKDVSKDIPPKIEICLYCGFSALQKKWYKNVLSRNLDEINRKSKSKTRLLNILMQLRKVCNHPYLFEGAEEGPPFIEGAHLYENSGKLALLDKLLIKLFAQDSRVLIFSQMTRMLDILEDYMLYKQYKYCRIDGSTKQQDRTQQMDEFNQPGSEKQVFLLSTRAGGLGINLQTADIVILYDSDWNPQMDIQAQDRAHRIGQTKPVYVYRLITEHSVEEKILDRCLKKLYLNAIVVRKGGTMNMDKMKNTADSLRNMVTFGHEYILKSEHSTINDQDIDAIINIGKQRTEQLTQNIQKAFDHNIMDFKMDLNEDKDYQTYDGMDYSNVRKMKSKVQPTLIIDHGPRRRNFKASYKENDYYRQLMSTINKKEVSPTIAAQKKIPREFNVSKHSKYKYDFQFVKDLQRLHVLEKKQFDAEEQERVQLLIAKEKFKKDCKVRKEKLREDRMKQSQKLVMLRREIAKNGGDTSIIKSKSVSLDLEDDVEDEFDEEAEWKQVKKEVENKIDRLTKQEQREMHRLTKDAFPDWNNKDFNQYIKGLVDFGKDSVDKIGKSIENKSLIEVRRYHKVFWQKYKKLENWKKLMDKIENAESKREENDRYTKLLGKKVGYYKKKESNNVLNKLKVVYEVEGEKKINLNNGYTELFDRFILIKVEEYGLDSWHDIKRDSLKSKLFWNNWLLRSKSCAEIKNRALKLLHLMDVAAKKKSKPNKSKKTTKKKATEKNKKSQKKKKPKKTENKKQKTKKKRKSKSIEEDDEDGDSDVDDKTSRGSSVSSSLSNASRKRLSKKYLNALEDALKPNTMVQIFDAFEGEWKTCKVIKHCERDIFTLYDFVDKGSFDQNFKNLKFNILEERGNDDEDSDDTPKSKRRSKSSSLRSNGRNKNGKKGRKRKLSNENIPNAKRRKIGQD